MTSHEWNLSRLVAIKREIRHLHHTYCLDTDERMVISHSLAACLILYIEQAKPRNIADLGSGFSSILFRRTEIPTVTVDTSRRWLDATRNWLITMSLPINDLILWDEFDPAVQSFDLVFVDLGGELFRKLALQTCFDAVSERGAIFVDDLQRLDLRDEFTALALAHGMRFDLLAGPTKDQFGRFAGLAWYE